MKNKSKTTIGKVISERRRELGLGLAALGGLVRKEDGSGISAQFIHDVEHGRRAPSSYVRVEIARVLGLDANYLAAVAGQCPAEITDYLREYPDAGSAVAALFARATAIGFVDWDDVEFVSKHGSAR